MGRALIDEVGNRYGKLTVVSLARGKRGHSAQFLCRCDCGKERTAFGYRLRGGYVRSCGCLRGLSQLRHGMARRGSSRSKIHGIWSSMLSRCTNPNVTAYRNYGARGIVVCERWHSFENFYADMGDRPEGMTLDRVDNDGPYSPENCRWTDNKTQTRNRRAVLVVRSTRFDRHIADIQASRTPSYSKAEVADLLARVRDDLCAGGRR